MRPARSAPVRWLAGAVSTGLALLVAVLVSAPGCGKKKETPVADPQPASPHDTGPRAGEFPVAERLAEKGGLIFRQKGCTACHAFGKLLTGPDLRGVTMRRSARWIERQILHPDIMLQEDPITIDLYNTYMVRMANQGLTNEETACVIEFLKWMDEDTTHTVPELPPGTAPTTLPAAPAAPPPAP